MGNRRRGKRRLRPQRTSDRADKMSMARGLLRRLAVGLMLALLLAQWATASYLCPLDARTAAAPAPATAPMPDCHGMSPGTAMDPAQPQLCKAHCEQGTQSVNVTPASEPSPNYGVWLVLDWHLAALPPLHAVGQRACSSVAASPPGAPPIYLALRVLRN
jgi:hypothetical protein